VTDARPAPPAMSDVLGSLRESSATVTNELVGVADSDGRSAGPRNPVEATMVGIWADLLGSTEPIGVHDNLFGLGSGSLAAVRFAARIADTYGVYLAIHHIVATPTIAALAEIVSADLDSARIAENAGGAELAALSDEELDDLLRALFAARDRRRAARVGGR
jgi:aryl carrier-like protein